MAGNSRLDAVKTLIGDEDKRKVRENWEVILSDKSLRPETQSPDFEGRFYDLLIAEMENAIAEKKLCNVRSVKKRDVQVVTSLRKCLYRPISGVSFLPVLNGMDLTQIKLLLR